MYIQSRIRKYSEYSFLKYGWDIPKSSTYISQEIPRKYYCLLPAIVFREVSTTFNSFNSTEVKKNHFKTEGKPWHFWPEVLREYLPDITTNDPALSNSGNVPVAYLCVNPQNRVLYGDIQISLIPKIYGFRQSIRDAKILNMWRQRSLGFSWFLRLGHRTMAS